MHENKYCPHCNQLFECNAGNITQCQCYGINISVQERAYINVRYTDCLCSKCLLQLKKDYVQFKNHSASK
jgi:hypothetical protein